VWTLSSQTTCIPAPVHDKHKLHLNIRYINNSNKYLNNVAWIFHEKYLKNRVNSEVASVAITCTPGTPDDKAINTLKYITK
jgi:hypothetical protein